jgi:hypothetical protein
LILISTVSGLNIGGFISVPLPKAEIDYIEDSGAFLFSLTKRSSWNIFNLATRSKTLILNGSIGRFGKNGCHSTIGLT